MKGQDHNKTSLAGIWCIFMLLPSNQTPASQARRHLVHIYAAAFKPEFRQPGRTPWLPTSQRLTPSSPYQSSDPCIPTWLLISPFPMLLP